MVKNTTKSWFIHEPLDYRNHHELRLLEVIDDSSGPIRCLIHAYSEPRLIGYTCLSYEWGPEESEDSMSIITVNDAQLRVRRNLWNFLNVFRMKPGNSASDQTVKLWIDAICIDQCNLKEKNEQVQRMGEIYRNAQRVSSWLGLAGLDGEASASGQFLRSQIEWARQMSANDFESLQVSEDWTITQAVGFVRHLPSADISFLVFAACRGYWDRAWILQEVSLAEDNIFWYEDVEMTRQRLRQLYTYASLLYAARQSPRSNLNAHQPSANNHRMSALLRAEVTFTPRNLYSILPDHLQTKCSNPADHIHSLLALTQEGSKIAVDHERSRVSLFFRTLWACRDSFCMCLAMNLIKALDIKEDLPTVAAANAIFRPSNGQADFWTQPFVEIANIKWHPNLDFFAALITEDDRERRRIRAPNIIQDGFAAQCRCSVVSSTLNGPNTRNQTVLCGESTFRITSSHMVFESQGSVYQMVAFLPGSTTGQSSSKTFPGVSLEPTEHGTFTLRFTLMGYLMLMQEFANEDKRDVCFHSRHQPSKVCFEYETT